jgi:hypothetical protein
LEIEVTFNFCLRDLSLDKGWLGRQNVPLALCKEGKGKVTLFLEKTEE